MDINISYYTAKGKREKNEDWASITENSNNLIAVVADGLGGHDMGEIASRQAATTINRELQGEQQDEDVLIDAIHQANTDILKLQNSQRSMLTTVAVLWVGEAFAIAANIGDSRIYQFRDGKIIYQSLDHSVAQMAALVGELDQKEIRYSKDRNKLIRVLGDAKEPKVDCETLTVQAGDRFLLCSDGFWEAVTEADMVKTMLESGNAKQWLEKMRQIVEDYHHPGQDNHTAIALIVE